MRSWPESAALRQREQRPQAGDPARVEVLAAVSVSTVAGELNRLEVLALLVNAVSALVVSEVIPRRRAVSEVPARRRTTAY